MDVRQNGTIVRHGWPEREPQRPRGLLPHCNAQGRSCNFCCGTSSASQEIAKCAGFQPLKGRAALLCLRIARFEKRGILGHKSAHVLRIGTSMKPRFVNI